MEYIVLFIVGLVSVWFLVQKLFPSASANGKDPYECDGWKYQELKELIHGRKLPATIVNLDIFTENVKRTVAIASKKGKTIRIGTKSVRVPELLEHIFKVGGSTVKGIMTFSVDEAKYLYDHLDILKGQTCIVPYPTVQKPDLETTWTMVMSGISIILTVDCVEHIKILDKFWDDKMKSSNGNQSVKLKVCVDIDMSFRMFGGLIHLGARRSPIHSLEDFQVMLNAIQSTKYIQLAGLMGYEAQVAGLPDDTPYGSYLNPIKRFIKWISMRDLSKLRTNIAKLCKEQGVELEFFNGGGTGSLKESVQDNVLTEITVGSGFLQSKIFDYFKDNVNKCAFVFALQTTRYPADGTIVCQSGGFIASGQISPEKEPVPFLPRGITTDPNEGFGEVQTPLNLPYGVSVGLGDPIFFRPAKAGELAERFNEYLLMQHTEHGTTLRATKTYRGLGWNCF